MSDFVLDASVALAWLLDEETGARANRALRRLEREDALVPQLWHLEVRNGLLSATRRGRLTGSASSERLEGLRHLPVRTDRDPDLGTAFVLAERHVLSFYDAIYLELAVRHEAPLATLDKALAGAAAASGLPLVCDPAPAG